MICKENLYFNCKHFAEILKYIRVQSDGDFKMLVCTVLNIKVKVSSFHFVSSKACLKLVIYGGTVYTHHPDHQGCDRQHPVELDRSWILCQRGPYLDGKMTTHKTDWFVITKWRLFNSHSVPSYCRYLLGS